MSASASRCTALAVALALTATPSPARADESHTTLLIPHVYPLRATTSDTQGTATVSTTRTAMDATINANVAFAKDSAHLQPAARQRITQLAQDLQQRSPGTLTITGYTDNLGSHEHGVTLSKQRAQAVAQELGRLDKIHVSVSGRAEADPVAPNTTEQGRARNRRVELQYQARG